MVTASESDAATSSPKHSMDVDEDEPMEHESIKLDAINGAKLKGLNGSSNGHAAKHANGLVNGFKHGSNGVSDDEKSSDAEIDPKMAVDDKVADEEAVNNENKCNGGDNHAIENSEASTNGDEAVVGSEERVRKYKLLKLEKNLKLKQLKLDLCNEEAKLMLLKRLYYSQKLMPSLQKPQQAPSRGQIGAGVQNKGLLQQQQQRPLPNSSNIQQQPRTLINNNRVFIGILCF